MIRLTNVSKVFGTGVAGLSDVNLSIDKGEFVFLVGHTGSGKTTLLKLIIRETLPTQGEIQVADIDVVKLPEKQVSRLRKKIGFVFQDFKLLTDRTIFENVMLPLEIAGKKFTEARNRVEELLDQVGIMEHKDKFPIQLSGGELQRAAIARALTLTPDIILADEPTGNLDAKTASDIVDLLSVINQTGTTIVMVTHNLEFLKKYPNSRVVGLDKGKVVRDEKHEKKTEEKNEKEEKNKKSADAKTVADKEKAPVATIDMATLEIEEKPAVEDDFAKVFKGKIEDKLQEKSSFAKASEDKKEKSHSHKTKGSK